jgi:hypothetical protein
MLETKGLLQSRTFWAAAIGLIATLFQFAGIDHVFGDTAAQAGFIDAVFTVIQGVSFVAAAMFRALATTTIAKT